MSSITENIVDVETVAKALGCSTRTVEDKARSGHLPGLKYGDGGWVFPVPALIQFLSTEASQQALNRRSEVAPPVAALVPIAGRRPPELRGPK